VPADSPLRAESERRGGATPLRRTPKELLEEPTAFDAIAGPGGLTLRPQPGGTGRPARRPTGAGAGFTDEAADLVFPDESASVDPEARARALRIASLLSVVKPRWDATARRGSGDAASLPYREASDEIDLDATLDLLAEKPLPEDQDIIVRERVRTGRSVVLAVDVSGSMKGERIRTAAAAVGALAGELGQDALGVIAFWSDAAVLLRLGGEIRPLELVDDILRIPARGLTNVGFPLELAGAQLRGVPQRDARVILLSDCVHNAGPDPRPVAGRLPRLDVLLDASGEKDLDLGRDLARVGRGRFRTVRSHHDVAPALTALFRP
jgi:Mg-chelatase subunit ChlD